MAFRPRKEFVESLTTDNASTGLDMSGVATVPLGTAKPRGLSAQLRVRPDGCDVVIKLGTSTVAADRTLTSKAMADKNFTIADGAIEIFNIDGEDTHVSCQKYTTGDSNCAVHLTLGYYEHI